MEIQWRKPAVFVLNSRHVSLCRVNIWVYPNHTVDTVNIINYFYDANIFPCRTTETTSNLWEEGKVKPGCRLV